METCFGAGCGRPVKARGLCGGHYARARSESGARLDVPVAAIPRPTRSTCSVDGCVRTNSSHGLCGSHAARLRNRGTLDPYERPTACSVCGAPPFSNGLCADHYPAWARVRKRERYLLTHYGMTPAQWEEMFDAQDRRCAVCLSDESRGDRGWHVHHDHDCCPGKRSCGRCVVAILCVSCNIGIGSLGDDPDRLARAAAIIVAKRLALGLPTT